MDILSRRRPALEIIDFQDTVFGSQLESYITEIQTRLTQRTDEITPIVKSIEQLITKRLGLKCSITINAQLAAIMPFYINKHHIFLPDLWRGRVSVAQQEKIIREAHDRTGWVDLEHARVGGIFADYENLVYINFEQLITVYHLSPAEITAVLLHELGHGFYACEYSDRLASTNQVLADIALHSTGTKVKDLKYIYRELSSVNPQVTETDVERMVTGPSVIAGYHWFKYIVQSVQSQKPNDTYDRTAFEQLADNFASRFGYAKPLLTGLDKLTVYYGSPERSRAWATFGLMMSTMAMAFSMTIIVLAMIEGAIPSAVLYLVYMTSILYFSGEASRDYTYDELRLRYRRMRNDFVIQLKDYEIPKPQLKGLLEQVYAMDTVIAETSQYSTIWRVLSNLLFSQNRRAKSAIEEEQLLESLATNDLFLKAAEFKTL